MYMQLHRSQLHYPPHWVHRYHPRGLPDEWEEGHLWNVNVHQVLNGPGAPSPSRNKRNFSLSWGARGSVSSGLLCAAAWTVIEGDSASTNMANCCVKDEPHGVWGLEATKRPNGGRGLERERPKNQGSQADSRSRGVFINSEMADMSSGLVTMWLQLLHASKSFLIVHLSNFMMCGLTPRIP